ncbi:MAG: hypothetical protein ACRDTT_11465 [Pseudonocardiaceae bacterium]
MNVQWKHWHRQPRSGSLGHDELEHIAVGDPDPTSDPGTANGRRSCRFEWADEISQTLVLPWSCTRKLGHQGQHLAGTGEWVAAAYPQLLPTATVTSVSV